MDDFVCDKLNQWDLSEWITKFKDEGIDKENLHCLEDEDIDKLIPRVEPRARFKEKLKLLKVLPSTSEKGKRKMDLQGEPNEFESPSKRQRGAVTRSFLETMVLSDLKLIMGHVHMRLGQKNTALHAFLKSKILDLEIDRRELVGVFGKTGAGKSSLINAVIGQKNLLPSGSVNACTSVMIKVEGNMHSTMYEAEIQFITKEEWKDELESMKRLLGNNTDKKKEDDEHHDVVEKLSALYADEWKRKSWESLMDRKYFTEIPEFLLSRKKTLTCESAKELSAKFVKYTRSDTERGEGTEVTRWFWPLVKCVTLKVPNSDLLQHVTLVDLPGNGDRNKSRDQMWKRIVGKCSTVWIVTEINRAASEKEAWEILKSAAYLLGKGGKCQRVHFICTKSDFTEDLDDHSTDFFRTGILERNMQAKEEVRKEFNKLNTIKKHFSDDSFKVFTVSSKEFFEKDLLTQEDTEIPQLQEFLENFNDCQTETITDVSAAHEILSLIQRASCTTVAVKKREVCEDLEKTMSLQLNLVEESMDQSYNAFEKCLTKGVDDSKRSCEESLKSFLCPTTKTDGAFHGTLKSVVSNRGIYKPRIGKEINLNMMLASFLTDSIDEEFNKTFPNDETCGLLNYVISEISLDTEGLIQKYKDHELQLLFLKTEEERMKRNLNTIIKDCKQTIYNSLMETIQESMQESYRRAAQFRGKDSLRNMINTIENHVRDSKATMFDRAKDAMLNQLKDFTRDILRTLEDSMRKSIELLLRTDDYSIPDVSAELVMVEKLCHELKSSLEKKT